MNLAINSLPAALLCAFVIGYRAGTGHLTPPRQPREIVTRWIFDQLCSATDTLAIRLNAESRRATAAHGPAISCISAIHRIGPQSMILKLPQTCR